MHKIFVFLMPFTRLSFQSHGILHASSEVMKFQRRITELLTHEKPQMCTLYKVAGATQRTMISRNNKC